MNVATGTGKSPDPENPDVPTDPGKTEDPTDPKNGHLKIEKTTTSTPTKDGKYQLGETIKYSVTVTNDGNLTLTDVVVTDELTNNTWNAGTMVPGDSKTFTATHVVTEDDVLAGKVVNVATGTGKSPDPENPDVPTDPGKTEDPTDPKNGHLTIVKTTTSTPKENGKYQLGETIEYSVTVTNDGNLTLTDVVVTDELTGDTWEVGTMVPGDSKTYTATHVVTEDDILAGKVVNVATGKGTSPDPEKPEVPTDPGKTEDPTDPKNGHLTIVKTTTSTPTKNGKYQLGETIEYSVTVTNDGNLTLTDVVAVSYTHLTLPTIA